MNSLLARPLGTPIGPLDHTVKALALPFSLDELIAAGANQSPEILRQEAAIGVSQAAAQLARREFYPDFGVGWEYMNRTSGMPEMYALRFSMNMPFFNRAKRKEALAEALATEASARHERDVVQNETAYRVQEQYLQARTSEELLDLYEKTLVPQAKLALDSAQAAYETGAVDFLNVISNFIVLLEYETSVVQERAKYQQALAKVQEITGLALVK